jgi:hypothetical protein
VGQEGILAQPLTRIFHEKDDLSQIFYLILGLFNQRNGKRKVKKQIFEIQLFFNYSDQHPQNHFSIKAILLI